MASNKTSPARIHKSARYVIEFIGGQTAVIEIPEWEDIDIAVTEQHTAYGDCEVDMIYPEQGTPRIERHGFGPEYYED